MLILLMIFLLIASIAILIVKHNKESLLLFGMCSSLAVNLIGVMTFIAKKGGILKELQQFLFLTTEIKTYLQYFLITLDKLGIIISLGRHLFPLFLILLAIHYSMIPWIRKNRWIEIALIVLPVITLIVYYPDIFRFLTYGRPYIQQLIVQISAIWIRLYVIVGIGLLIYEYISITMKFYKRQFIQIIIFILSISILYFLYSGQDPAQVYQFYGENFIWKQGIYYMNATLSIGTYYLIVFVNIIFSIIGFTSLYRYTQINYATDKEEIVMQRKFDTASVGASVFVHSIKNQLLSNQVLHNRIDQIYEEDTLDQEKLKENIDSLAEVNDELIFRIEELYKSVKSNAIYLIPITLEEIVNTSIERFQRKYPDDKVIINMDINSTVLADKLQLCEAIYNLLINAQEAVNAGANSEEGQVSLLTYNERLYTVIEVRDNGIGIDEPFKRKVFEPFYSSKSSSSNWGMGLHYVRTIVKGHFGTLRYESKFGEGTSFYVLLPRFKD